MQRSTVLKIILQYLNIFPWGQGQALSKTISKCIWTQIFEGNLAISTKVLNVHYLCPIKYVYLLTREKRKKGRRGRRKRRKGRGEQGRKKGYGGEWWRGEKTRREVQYETVLKAYGTAKW